MSNLVSSPKNVVYVNGGQTYNVSAADDVINVNSNLGATEIVLPNIVNQGLDFYPKKFTVNDTGGVAGTNPITISAVGNIVNSGTSFLLNRNNVSSEIVIVSKTEYLVNTDNGGSTGVFGSGVAGQLAYFSASTVLGSLTNAQVTVLIDPMVGDSGSGGLKGLVPAPAAGDAAANKYLKADGTWNAISFAGYLKADGTVPLTANWDVGAFEVTAQSLKVDGTAGAGHFHLRYQSTIPTGAANNSKLFSGATGELGWVVDSNAYAFYLDMTGNTASRTLTVPNASGTIALTTDIVNLGNSDLTSTDNARYFKLNGTTSSNFLKFRNSSDISILSLFGDKSIVFGNSGNPVSINFNIDASDATGDTWYRNSGGLMTRLGIGTSGQVLTVAAGLPSWATLTVNNLGNSNLTSTDDARTFTLKSGTTATQNLQFLNSAGKKGFYFDGRGKVGFLTSTFDGTYGGESTNINFGDSTNKVAVGIHLDNVSGSQYYAFRMFSGANVLQNVDARGVIEWYNQTNNANIDIRFGLSGNGARITTNSPSTSLWQVGYGHYYNGTPQVQIATDNSTNGYLTVHKSDGSVTNIISGNRPYEATWFAQGIVLGGARYRAATPFFDVMGSGSTSATTTALFQNSSSVNTLSLRDDGVVQLGVNGATGIRFDPYGRTSFAMLQYLAAGSTYASLIYDSLNRQIFQINSGGQVSASVPSGGTAILNLNSTINFEAVAVGDNFAYTSKNSLGNYTMYLRNQGNVGTFELMNSAGVNQLYLAGANGSYILNNLAIGKNTSATSGVMLEVVGVINAPQITNTPATITVAANAGTVTRANRINNFTNSSAATMTITMSTTSALDADLVQVRIYDFSGSAQTITWVNTENSSVAVPATSNGSTTLPLTVGFQYNSATSKWRCIGSV